MRAVLRRRHEEEEESAFVSMTDMTVSFLFIVMILLAFFASQLHSTDTVPRKDLDMAIAEAAILRRQVDGLGRTAVAMTDDILERDKRIRELEEKPLKTYIHDVMKQREQILEMLKSKLTVDFPDLQVVISDEMDALRFKGDGLFQAGSSELRSDKRRIVESIATRLKELLPCYTLGSRSSWREGCNEAGAAIEAVQIEGHTDADGLENNNVTLSTNRANETLFAMIRKEATLPDYLNNRKQPVLSVAGYGRMRPIADNATPEGKATNRRIDLRIIMYTPRSIDDIQKIRDDLHAGIAAGEAR